MSSIQTLNNVNKNRGYLIGNKKIYGKKSLIENSQNVKLIGNNRKLHTWGANFYVEKQMGCEEKDEEGWYVVKTRKTIKKVQMNSCPFELNNNGNCEHKNDFTHSSFYYHYSILKDGNVYCLNGKPVCRYSNKSKDNYCWQLDDKEHTDVFCHC